MIVNLEAVAVILARIFGPAAMKVRKNAPSGVSANSPSQASKLLFNAPDKMSRIPDHPSIGRGLV
ncbi:hypothetical protein EOD23_02005 [Mesorhizobium sp. USDA-HM6]|nr:hypothetical protein EOD23_02005 [Mesorhizobium sp. USDA-HM6]